MFESGKTMGLNSTGPEVGELHAALRALGFLNKASAELCGMSFGVGTRDALLGFQRTKGIGETGLLDEATQAELTKALESVPKKRRVLGKVGAEAGTEIRLRLYRLAFREKTALADAIELQKDGYYELEYDTPAQDDGRSASSALSIELEAEYFDTTKKKKTSFSTTKYKASAYEVLNFSLPTGDDALKTEYEKMLEALLPQIGNEDRLRDLKEEGKQKEISFLANATGVKVREILLASTAARMSAQSGVEAKALYALYKGGFPANERALCLAEPEQIKDSLESAQKSGLVRLDGTVDETVEKIKKYAKGKRPDLCATAYVSSYRELLDCSGLTDEEKEGFLGIFFSHRGSASGMWKKVETMLIARTAAESGLRNTGKPESESKCKEKLDHLKMQGKLIYLTSGNAPIMKRLISRLKLSDRLSVLAEEGYDKPEKWESLIRDEAKDGKAHTAKKIEDFIPPAYAGESVNESLAAYASDMARMVRASFPLQCLRRKIRDKELIPAVSGGEEERDEIINHLSDFLFESEKYGFKPGAMALGKFFKTHEDEFFKKPVDLRVKTGLVRAAEEKLERSGARSFFIKNWKETAKGVRSEKSKADAASAALMSALRSKDFRAMSVSDFLGNASKNDRLKMRLGPEAADGFVRNLENELKREKELIPDKIEAEFKRKVKEAVKTLVRLFQIAPGDDALQILYNIGVKSAHGITTFSAEAFHNKFVKEATTLASARRKTVDETEIARTAGLIYKKAWLIHAAAINVVASAGQIGGAAVRKISGTRSDDRDIDATSIALRPATKKIENKRITGRARALTIDRHKAAMAHLIEQYPTLEELLGSTDYSECRECQSIIGPAAYLVDLFRFLEHIDPDLDDEADESWQAFVDTWKVKHNASYPFKSVDEEDRWAREHPGQQAFSEMTPYQILLKHRPDLPHLPLTCENTNTLVPYIDLVNEILEFYLVNPHAADESEEELLEEFLQYDTGNAESADLLAEPQNVLPPAYDILRDEACYPLILPFDLWIETVRLFFDHFETPLWKALETFRAADELPLFAAGATIAPPPDYYRYQIFSEYLGFSSMEYELFTESTQRKWFELYGYAESSLDARVVDELKSAKFLSRRLGVTYKELVEIVKTRFVNPGLENLSLVWEMGLEIADAVDHFRHGGSPGYETLEAAYAARLEEAEAKYGEYFAHRQTPTTVLAELESLWPQKFRETLVLRDRTVTRDGVVRSDFSETYLEYACVDDGVKPCAAASDFIRINLFVRLWRKLGLSIEETDWALKALWPKNIPITLGPEPTSGEVATRWKKLADGFTMAILYLAHAKYLEEKLKTGKSGRQKLLTLWADMPAKGSKSLYAQLFLKHPFIKDNSSSNDPRYNPLLDPLYDPFDDPFGRYLTDSRVKMIDPLSVPHMSVLRGALGLSDEDIRRIITDANVRPAEDADVLLSETTLSLATVSLLYRYGFLAKSLKLSVKDLIALKTISGIKPFAELYADVALGLDDDYPYSQTIRFVEMAEKFAESGLRVEDLDFLLRHRFDPLGKYRAEAKALPALLRSLSGGIRNIEEGLAAFVASPPSDGQLKDKLAQLLPADSADVFLKILSGTMEFEAAYPQEEDGPSITLDGVTLDQAVFSREPDVRVSLDEVRAIQHLYFRGFLTETRKKEILDLMQDSTPAKKNMVEELLKRVQARAGDAFARALWGLMETADFSAVKRAESVDALPAENFKDFPVAVYYDKENQLQHLSYQGLLISSATSGIVAALGTSPPSDQLALLQALLDKVGAMALDLFVPLFKACVAMVFSGVSFKVWAAGSLDEETVRILDNKEGALGGLVHATSEIDTADIQYLSYRGLLGSAEKERIVGLVPEGSILRALLDEVQKRQVELLQTLRANFLAEDAFTPLFTRNDDGMITESDLGDFPAPEGKSRTELALSLLPFLSGRLEARFVAETFATETGADPATVQELLSKPILLADPSILRRAAAEDDSVHADPPLYAAFAEAGTIGADVMFQDAAGTAILIDGSESALMSSIDTAALKEDGHPYRPALAATARFEAWFKVPTDGFYRFFAVRDPRGRAGAEFRLADLPDPVLQLSAAGDVGEASGVLELKGEVPYRFTFEAKALLDALGAEHKVRLEIVGDKLSRRNLGDLGLFPAGAVERVEDARTLMVKTLQILRALELSERETLYFLNHRTLFDDLDFGLLALRDAQTELEKIAKRMQREAAGDGPLSWPAVLEQAKLENSQLAREADRPRALLMGLLRLIEFAALKRELSPDSDDLILAMANSRGTYREAENPDWNVLDKAEEAHFERIAALTRRQREVVLATAKLLRFTLSSTALYDSATLDAGPKGWLIEAPELGTEKGIRRLWEALQIVERFGLPLEDFGEALKIVRADTPGFLIARDLRNAVKARYGAEDWRLIIKGISDVLRAKKRDALVASIMGAHPEIFTMREKLFEYFLVDPGMEPVVKTSRIRMAIESVRRFVQRCLDDKETWVSPSAINKEQWKVRGCFRFWQANRRIFLYPENWLEPELRDDKTHLFRELEGTLLQGDVSEELVEDAFFKYMNGLEQIARLEIMTLYREAADDPHAGWLHVIGRTHNPPYKYFYRWYDGSEWSPWEPVSEEIEGNNVVAIVWKQRLHLFWLTFKEMSVVPETTSETASSGETIEGMAQKDNPEIVKKKIDVQLNWIDYFQGEWRSRQTSEYQSAILDPKINVGGHNEDGIIVYAAKERDSGIEGAVKIHYTLPYRSLITKQGTRSKKIVVPAEDASIIEPYIFFRLPVITPKVLYVGSYSYILKSIVDTGCEVFFDIESFGLLPVTVSDETIDNVSVTIYYFTIPEHSIVDPDGDTYEYFEYGPKLYFNYSASFRLLNKNCPPEIVSGDPDPWRWTPYSLNGLETRRGARYWGKGALSRLNQPILRSGNEIPRPLVPYPTSLVVPDDPDGPTDNRNDKKFLRSFFYQDGVNVFFVKPRLILDLGKVEGWGDRSSDEEKPEKEYPDVGFIAKR